MAEGGRVKSEARHVGDGEISNTVEVRGFSKNTSQEVLEMYFENSRRSGGGDVDEVQIVDGVAYITFKEAEVAQRVISHNHHQLDGQTLTVTHPSPPKSYYQNRILIQGLNNAVTEELLKNFLEKVTEAKVREFLYGEEEGNVVVTLSDNIDIGQLRKTFQESRVKGAVLKVSRVAISNCIIVHNVQSSTSRDALLFYFENKKRSGGGDVERVEMKTEDGYCLVYFEDHSVIDRVLLKSHHVDGADVEVYLHHECLGRRSSRNKSDPYLRISSQGNKDSSTLEEENTDNQSNDEDSSSVSSNPDKDSDFVEVQEWQENDGGLPTQHAYLNIPSETVEVPPLSPSPQQGNVNQSPAVAESEVHWGEDDNGEQKKHGKQHSVWTYPNNKVLVLLKDSTCNADVVIIPEMDNRVSTSGSNGKDIVGRLSVPLWNKAEKEKHTLNDRIKEVLMGLSGKSLKSVGICINPVGGWDFKLYFKCFLYEISTFYTGSSVNNSVECLSLFTNDEVLYHAACVITQTYLTDKARKSSTEAHDCTVHEGTVAAGQLRTKPADTGVSEVLKYGQVHIQAKLGAFEDEEQNCLLVFWDMQWLYRINDKNKILHSAGKEVIQKWNEHRNGKQFHKKVILVTPGNNLKYMKIIHVASDITSIYDDAKAGLRKADAEEMKTIVVPIFDKDPFYRDVNTFCAGILRAIKELATELKLVESVTLVIQGKHTFSFFSYIFEQESRQYGTGKKPVNIGSVDDTSWELIDEDEIALEGNKSVTRDDSSINEKRKGEVSVSSPQIQDEPSLSAGMVDGRRNSSDSQIKNNFSALLEQIRNTLTADTVHLPGGKPVETTEGKKSKRHQAGETISGQTPEGKADSKCKTESSLLSSGHNSNESEKELGQTPKVEISLTHTDNSDLAINLEQTGQECVGKSDVERNSAQIPGSRDNFTSGTKDPTRADQDPTHVGLENAKPDGVGTSSTHLNKDPIIGQAHGVDTVRVLEADTFDETLNLIASADEISEQEPYHTCEGNEGSPGLGQSGKLGKKNPHESERNADSKVQEMFSKLCEEEKDDTSGGQNYGKDGAMEDKKPLLMETNRADLEQIDNRNLDPVTGVADMSDPKRRENEKDMQEKSKPNLGLLTGVISLPCRKKTSGGTLAEYETNQIERGEKHGVKNQEPDQTLPMQETKNGSDQDSHLMPFEKRSFRSDGGCDDSVVTLSLDGQPVEDINCTSDEMARMEGPTTSKEGAKTTDTSLQATSTKLGNTQVINLLINYLKKQGEKNEVDFTKHQVSCSRNFQLMWNFYTQTDCGKKMLDVIAVKHHCKVSLSTVDQFNKSFIFQVSNAQFQEESDVKNFVDGVLDSVYICAQESLSTNSIEFDHRVQDDVREKLKERKELDCAWIELVSESKPATVYIVCVKEHQQPVVQIITEVIKYATESFNSHREMVNAHCMWQRVVTRFEYHKEMSSKFPNTVIIQDENINAFQVRGPRDEVRAAAGHLEELLKMAHKEVHEEVFSPGCQFEIFTCPEMCKYIEECIPKLLVVWMPNHLTKKIHLFSRDSGQFKGIEKSIKGCIKERLYPLSKHYSKLPSEKIHSLDELKKIHKGKIVIHPSDTHTGLLVTVADDIFQSVDDAVSKIISSGTDEVQSETPVTEEHDGKGGHPGCIPELSATNPDIKMTDFPLEKVLVSDKNVIKTFEVKDKILFGKLCKEDMVELNQVAKEHCVSLHQLEPQGSRVGFELKGSEKEVQHIYEYLTERIQAEKQQMQHQNDNSVMAAGTQKAEQAASNGTAEMSQDSKVSAIAEEPGLEQRDWSYPNGKKITLLKATSCDANVIIIPGNGDKDSIFKRIRVKVQKGQLHEAQTEVLVNTISTNLDLKKGAISASLLKKAGPGLQKEISSRFQPPAPYGVVLKTGVCQLPSPCKAVYHGALKRYNTRDDSTMLLQQFVLNCLQQASKSKYKTIAFPAIGTGNLNFPKDIVSGLMLTTILKFERSMPGTFLKEVKFVIFPTDTETYQVFEKQLKDFQLYPEEQTIQAKHSIVMPAQMAISKTLQYGQVQVHAKLGTFENESQDCLLVFWDKQFLYYISKQKILHSAGSTVTQKWEEHRNQQLFKKDVILVTLGGNLKYTNIIHVACEINTINEAAGAGLMKADSKSMKTVAVPIISDDPFQRDVNKFCTGILMAVKEKATSLKSVQSVIFVIQGQHNFPFFNEVFEQESRKYRTRKNTEKVPTPSTETARTYLEMIGDASNISVKISDTVQERSQQFKSMAGKETRARHSDSQSSNILTGSFDPIKVPDEDSDVPGRCPSATNLSEVDQDDSVVYIECKIEVAEDVLNSIKITYGQQGIDSLISDLDQLAKVDTHEGSILVLCDYKYAENVQKCVRNHYNKAKEKRKIKIKEENKHLIHGGNENLEWLQFAYGHTSWSKNLQLEGGKLYLTGTLQMKREVEKAVHSMNYWYQEKFTLSSEEQQKADEIVTLVKGELPTIFIKQTKETMRVLSDNRDNFERANFKVKEELGRIRITARGRRYRDLLPYDESYSGLSKDDKMDAKHY